MNGIWCLLPWCSKALFLWISAGGLLTVYVFKLELGSAVPLYRYSLSASVPAPWQASPAAHDDVPFFQVCLATHSHIHTNTHKHQDCVQYIEMDRECISILVMLCKSRCTWINEANMKLYFGFKWAEIKCNEIQRNSYYCMALKYIVHFTINKIPWRQVVPSLKCFSGMQLQLLSLCMGKHHILPNCSLSLQ